MNRFFYSFIVIALLVSSIEVFSQNPPPPPVYLGLTDTGSLHPTLLWSRVPTAESYGFRVVQGITVIIDVSGITDTFYTIQGGLYYGITYGLIFRSYNQYGWGVWSPVYELIIPFPFGIIMLSDEIPAKYDLSQNYPNPFNPSTKINYELPVTNYVRLVVYDILGKGVQVLVNERQKPGTYEVTWDASGYPSGIYFYTLRAGEFSITKKMILVK